MAQLNGARTRYHDAGINRDSFRLQFGRNTRTRESVVLSSYREVPSATEVRTPSTRRDSKHHPLVTFEHPNMRI